MKHIIHSIEKWIKLITKKEQPLPLGRWNIQDCKTKINQKVDYSNEDHCGPCGQYAMMKQPLLQHSLKEKPKLKLLR
jgi:hypothetical protein